MEREDEGAPGHARSSSSWRSCPGLMYCRPVSNQQRPGGGDQPGSRLGGTQDRDAPPAPQLDEPFVTQDLIGPEDGVHVHVKGRCLPLFLSLSLSLSRRREGGTELPTRGWSHTTTTSG